MDEMEKSLNTTTLATNKQTIVDKRKSIENYPNWNLSEGAGRSWKNKGKGTSSLCL
jgi:hypothetical protein